MLKLMKQSSVGKPKNHEYRLCKLCQYKLYTLFKFKISDIKIRLDITVQYLRLDVMSLSLHGHFTANNHNTRVDVYIWNHSNFKKHTRFMVICSEMPM